MAAAVQLSEEIGHGSEQDASRHARTVLLGDLCGKVLLFCDWRGRAHVASLNRHALANFSALESHWEWMCRRLCEETLLFFPLGTLCAPSWRQLFMEMYPSRMFLRDSSLATGPGSPTKDFLAMIDGQLGGDGDQLTAYEDALSTTLLASRLKVAEPNPQTFQVKVVCRMKPVPLAEKSFGGAPDAATREDMGASVVLPLHQRLQLIRSERNCSQKEARQILWQRAGSTDPWADADVKVLSPPAEADENTPTNHPHHSEDPEAAVQTEHSKVQACVVAVTGGNPGSVLMCCPGTGLREFSFDAVLDEGSTQCQAYNSAPRRMVVDFINGKNASIFAFGQTGSGKTHTMFGPSAETGAEVLMVEAESDFSTSGIVPRACSDVLRALKQRRAQGVRARLRMSYVEIYGEQVTDLLNANTAVGQWQGVAHRAVFGGECAIEVEDVGHMRELLLRGDGAKRRAATAMNERSSRAHCLLMLELVQQHTESGAEVESFLAMADLGGSEQVLKSQVASLTQQAGGYMQADERLREAVNINLGLLALKTCIRHLVDKSSFVPYQNSRLTMMMSAVLASHCQTAVVITGSSEKRNAQETMLTLRFGEECSQVVTSGSSSIAAAARAIKALDVEIDKVEAVIRSKERWETVRTTRADALHQEDEATQATETVVTTKLVGAEEERARLEQLLVRRRILSGR